MYTHDLFNYRTHIGRRFEGGVFILIVISLIVMVLQTFVSEGSREDLLLTILDFAIWILFCIEYALRLVTSPVKRRYIFSFYGMVDLLAVVSGAVAVDALSGFKALRMLRVMRVLKFVRYSSAVDRFTEAYQDIKDELALYLAISGILTFIAAYGIWEFEHEINSTYGNIFDCVYWAVASLTAGAENMAPETASGKILTIVLLLIGLGIVAVPSGLLASALSKQDVGQLEQQRQVKRHEPQPDIGGER